MEHLNITEQAWIRRDHSALDSKSCFISIPLSRKTFAALKKTSVIVLLMLSVAPFVASAQETLAGPDQAAPTPSVVFAVSGVVLDPSNATIAGAKVSMRGKNSKSQRSTRTDPSGHFQFDAVVPDNYEIEVQQEGFKVSESRVKVGPRTPASLRIVLALSDLHEEITVTNPEGLVSGDVAENADVIRLDRQVLDSLPIVDNDVVGAVGEMLGPASGRTVLIVDGMVASDIGIPASAIQEVRINQNPYSAEFS